MFPSWLWIHLLRPAHVGAFKITNVNPKDQKIENDVVTLTITWQGNGNEKKGPFKFGWWLDDESTNTQRSHTVPPYVAMASIKEDDNPSVVTFSAHLAEGSYFVSGVTGNDGESHFNDWDVLTKAAYHDPISIKLNVDSSSIVTTQNMTFAIQETRPSQGQPSGQHSTTHTIPPQTSKSSLNPSSNTVTTSESETINEQTSTSFPTSNNLITPVVGSNSTAAGVNRPESANTTPTTLSSPSAEPGKRPETRNRATVIASVFGALALIILAILIVIYLRRWLKSRRAPVDVFNRNKMVRNQSTSEFQNPFYIAPSSRASSPVDTETITGTVITEKIQQFSRTDRQMEIEERVQQLQAQLIALHNQSELHKSQGAGTADRGD
ncbi:hypothetical protein VNI00_015101 [Paramarasmius palmivorus]|uniref:Uncharacterized protein n=1 Tax=Paramarasmius palmivorus TaxID=297713 RepID=A0AAW0BMP1_9AGAR